VRPVADTCRPPAFAGDDYEIPVEGLVGLRR
jgi:hypothetical protein